MTMYLKVGKLLVDAQMRQRDTASSTTIKADMFMELLESWDEAGGNDNEE